MNELHKKLDAFIAQNKHIIKPELPLFMDLKDALMENDGFKKQRLHQMRDNRVLVFIDKKNHISILADKPCQPMLVREGENFYDGRILNDHYFVGSEGVNEILALVPVLPISGRIS